MSIPRLISGLFFLLSFSVWSAGEASNAINSTLPVKAADCLIVDDQKNILMIDEAISGRYSIPGGSIIGDETPQQAAVREVYEETGLHVTVGKQIAQTYNSAIFSCEIKTPTPYFVDSSGRRVVMAWSAPHFGKEVTRVLLMPDNKTVRDNYRFPEHKWMFRIWVPEVSPSEFVLSPGESDALTPFYRSQLDFLQSLHVYRAQSPVFAMAVKAVVVLGSIFSPLFFLLTLSYIRAYHGHRAALIYGAGLMTVSIIALLMSTVIEVPRPYFIDPVFREHNTVGYTLPSTMVALTTFFFSWLLINWDKEKHPKGRKRVMLLSVVSVLLISAKVMIHGEHYPSDIVVGFAIGLFFSVGLRQLKDWRFATRNRALTSARFWFLAFIAAAIIGLGIHKPHIVYLSAICLGTWCALMWLKIFPTYVSAVRRPAKLTFLLIAGFGTLAIVVLDRYFSAKYAVNEVIVAMNCAAAWAIAVWVLVVTPRIFHRMSKQ